MMIAVQVFNLGEGEVPISFTAIHDISEPLASNANPRFICQDILRCRLENCMTRFPV